MRFQAASTILSAAVDGAIKHAGGGDLVGPQGGDEGQSFPMSVRHLGVQLLPALTAPVSAPMFVLA